MNEVDAIAFLLEKDIGFDQYGIYGAYKTDSWNKIGLNNEHLGFLVQHYEDGLCDKEWAFATAIEAAKFYVEKLKEL